MNPPVDQEKVFGSKPIIIGENNNPDLQQLQSNQPQQSVEQIQQPRPSLRIEDAPNIIYIVLESVRASLTTPYNPKINSTPYYMELKKKGLMLDKYYPSKAYTNKVLYSSLYLSIYLSTYLFVLYQLIETIWLITPCWILSL